MGHRSNESEVWSHGGFAQLGERVLMLRQERIQFGPIGIARLRIEEFKNGKIGAVFCAAEPHREKRVAIDGPGALVFRSSNSRPIEIGQIVDLYRGIDR